MNTANDRISAAVRTIIGRMQGATTLLSLVALFGVLWMANNLVHQGIVNLLPHQTTTYKVDVPMIVEEMKDLSRLECASFSAQKIVEADSQVDPLPHWLVGDRVLLVAHGRVIAGVDLASLKPEDVHARGQEVHVRLPQPFIFSVQLDDRSYVYDHKPGLLSRVNPDLESEARERAEFEFRGAALQSGILNRAKTSSQATIERLLRAAGASKVVFD